MKRRLLFLLLFLVLGIEHNAFSMDGFFGGTGGDTGAKFARGMRDAFDDVGRSIQHRKEDNERNARQRIEQLNESLAYTTTDEERKQIQKERKLLIKKGLAAEESWDDLDKKAANVVLGAYSSAIKIHEAHHLHQQELEKTAINAESNKEAAIAQTKQYIKALKDPKNAKLLALTATAVAVGICGAWHGSKLLASLIQQYMHKIPTIAEETSLVSVKDKIVNYFAGHKLESNINDVVLEKNLAARVSRLAIGVKNTVANGGFFRHLLFYGPPGTGKTMLAKRIARSSGLEYIYFAGGSALEQLEIEDALSRLTELFEFAKRSPKKLMIIIDEAEVLLADRRKKLSDKTRKLLNLVLGYTGTEQNNFVVVALTNRPEDLDSAFLSRCDEQIKIGVPAPAERLGILELYVNKFLLSRVKNQTRPSFLARLFGAKASAKGLSCENDVLSKDSLADIAEKLDGFVGRDISKLVIAVQSEAYASPKGCITKAMVNEVVQQKITQKAQQQNGWLDQE